MNSRSLRIIAFLLVVLAALTACSAAPDSFSRDTDPFVTEASDSETNGKENTDTDDVTDGSSDSAAEDTDGQTTSADTQKQEPPTPPLPVFSEMVFEEAHKIGYTREAVGVASGSANGEIKRLEAQKTVLVVGESESWIRIKCGEELGYIPKQLVSYERPSNAIAASEASGGTVYPGDDRVVAIDAGHQNKGMKEKEPNGPGSDVMKAKLTTGTQGVSTGIAEYILNLDVALLLRDELISRGYTVVMIRETHEVRISNVERALIANKAGVDAFVRIHANGSEDKTKNGATAFCQSKNNKYQDLYEQSSRLSNTMLDAFSAATGMYRREVWETDTMTGINWAEMPTVIMEMGYMSNAADDEKMATDKFKADAAIGLANGFDKFFSES